VDPERGWVSGANGTIFRTDNGGREWKPQRQKAPEQLFAIRFVSHQKGFSVGSFGTLLKTDDGGNRWEKVKLDWNLFLKDLIAQKGYLEPHLNDLFFLDRARGWIVGEFGLILHTKDSGETWSLQDSGIRRALFKVFFMDHRKGWVVGQNGTLLTTEDGGSRWRKVEAGVAESLFNVSVQDQSGLIVGERGTVLQSSDGGISWVRLVGNPFRFPSWLQGVSALEGNRYILVGDRGSIFLVQ
jgi:photosystem II stability/assembly factor-like uncharacterized protein